MRIPMRGALRGLAPALLLAAALLAPAMHAGAQSSRTLVFAQSGDAVKLDPALIEDGLSARVTEQIFEGLVTFDGATTRIKPALAESWDTSADGKVWTFHLRQGVTFHDGTPLDAAAVKANFDRQQSGLGDPSHKSAEFIYWYNVVAFNDLFDHTDVIDSSTFQITLKDSNGAFLLDLALFPFAIVSPGSLAMLASGAIPDITGAPVGTGPFKFVEWVRGDHITLAANDNYWGGRPQIDQVVIRVINDNAARFFELQAGNIDMMEFPNPDDVKVAQNTPSLQVLFRPSLNIGFIDFNEFEKPYGDVRVRQALSEAVNRQAIVDSLYGGTGLLAKEFLAPGMLGYNDDVQPIPYDPAHAKQLLADAGMPTGFTTDFWYMPVDRPYYPNPQAIAQAVCNDWAQVGVKCNLKTKDWTAYLDDARNHKLSTWMAGWTGDNGDPDNFLFYFYGTKPGPTVANNNTWDNSQVRDLLLQAQRSVDDGQRDALYKQVATIVRSETPKIPMAHTTPPLFAQSYVQGYVTNPTGTELFNTVTLDGKP
ncbi:MAG TPA: ABC transporter substrate-binding protein [Chloroflexota bacterium]|nr:ABC transporter substrate-binding protein [Chloroflexota bacterium]